MDQLIVTGLWFQEKADIGSGCETGLRQRPRPRTIFQAGLTAHSKPRNRERGHSKQDHSNLVMTTFTHTKPLYALSEFLSVRHTEIKADEQRSPSQKIKAVMPLSAQQFNTFMLSCIWSCLYPANQNSVHGKSNREPPHLKKIFFIDKSQLVLMVVLSVLWRGEQRQTKCRKCLVWHMYPWLPES